MGATEYIRSLLLERRDAFAGRVVLMFQPGEEGYHGARFMIDDGTNRGPNQPVRTNCTTAYATCDAQSQAVFDHCPSGQVFDKRFSICVVKDACDEVRS